MNTTSTQQSPKIVSIHLIKNEDIYIKDSINNVIDYVDEVIVLDNKSTDKTKDIILNTYKNQIETGKLKYVVVDNPCDTNKYLEEFIATNTWIIGVDGDEIYSYTMMDKICKNIKDNIFKDIYRLDADVLNVTATMKLVGNVIEYIGYKSPPSKGMIKIYNFNHVKSISPGERLHGKYETTCNKIYHFMPGTTAMMHMCFMKRSSVENMEVRPAPEGHGGVQYKMQAYRKGDIVREIDGARQFIAST